MARPQQAASLISEGLSPAQIAARWGITTGSVVNYIFVAIGEGRIKHSDVLFTIDRKTRQNVEEILNAAPDAPAPNLLRVLKSVYDIDADVDELKLYLMYRRNRVHMADLYEFLATTERVLHEKIKSRLKKHFGNDEVGWWRKGVPVKVRVDCAQARERDPDYVDEPYEYTTIIHLKEIIDERWGLLFNHLPIVVSKNKKKFLSDLGRLNGIRNQVMHPVRGRQPTEDDFEFLREMHRAIVRESWR